MSSLREASPLYPGHRLSCGPAYTATMKRRTVLLSSLLGAATVTLAGGSLLWLERDPARARAQVLRAIAPVLLDGATMLPAAPRESGPEAVLPTAALDATLTALEAAVVHLPRLTRIDLDRLFVLLASAPGRRWLAGVDAPWDRASSESIAAFLEAWRSHSSPLLRGAYGALHDLVLASWYAQPAHWAAIGYPGPNLPGPRTS